MYGQLTNYLVEYELLWANKVVESDIIEVTAYDHWRAERDARTLIQSKNKKATVVIKNIIC
jgi:hypothetical protein